MSSRLYAAAFSSGDSDSDDEEEMPVRNIDRTHHQIQSDSEDEKRVVRSAKDKRYEEIQNVLRSLTNHKKIKDMTHVMADFEELVKLYEKSCKMNELEIFPKFYVKCLAQLEDFINESWEQKKSLNKTAAKSLTSLKQRLKKYIKDFEDKISEYRAHPELYEDEVDEEEEAELASELSDNEEVNVKVKKTSKNKVSKADSDDFSEELNNDSSDWSSDSDRDIETLRDNPAAFFLKKDPSVNKPEKLKKKKIPKSKPTKVLPTDDNEPDAGEWKTVDSSGRIESTVQAFEKGVEITFDLALKKLNDTIANRGKRTSTISEQISLLEQVCDKIVELRLGVGIHVKCMLSIITVLFDYESKHPDFMPIQKFKKALEYLNTLFEVLEQNSKDLTVSDTFNEETESIENCPYRINGSILSATGRLDDEFYRILQNANGHEIEYDERLRDEPVICALLEKLSIYLERTQSAPDAICKAYMRRVEHMYYKFDFEWARRVEHEGFEAVGVNSSYSIIERLCQYIYKYDTTDRLRTRAILCHIYSLALFDHWYKARDLMLMSNLQVSIDHADQSTMILFNRAMVQMGLCAFRQGHFRDTHATLSELTGSGRIRELLAQGLHMQPRYEKTPEEEKREKALQVPYHMHINTELIECIYLISAMIQEMPSIAASHDSDTRTRAFSKAFLMALRIHDRATLVGPPETPKDHVIAASKAMRMGNWRACFGLIFNPKMEAKIWVMFTNFDRVKKLLEAKIKEECLRCYLFVFSSVHDSISLARLAEHFELQKSEVYSIISKMIINQELAASLEVPADFLTMHKGERSRLQLLALQLSDKVNNIVEMNEKLIENRGGLISGPKGIQSYQGPRRQRFVQGPKFI